MPITKPPLFPNTRPQFSRDLRLKQFSAYYWYKDELAAICRQIGLETAGTTAELQNRIVKKFYFTKEMAAALRDAEKRGDLEMTVADLIAVYEKNKNQKAKAARKTAEEKTYQWNSFVRDFNREARTRSLANRMQVAALLWRQVCDRAGVKTYSPQLLDEFAEAINKMSKSQL